MSHESIRVKRLLQFSLQEALFGFCCPEKAESVKFFDAMSESKQKK